MKIIPASKEFVKEISALMLADLENPNPKFPMSMIIKFREHAEEKNISKEFDNSNLISFLAIQNNKLVGFIVGYQENAKNAIIHYLTCNDMKAKKSLLNRFIGECKNKNIESIMTDTFEFMDNNDFFKKAGFRLIKKEKITDSLEMLWYGSEF